MFETTASKNQNHYGKSFLQEDFSVLKKMFLSTEGVVVLTTVEVIFIKCAVKPLTFAIGIYGTQFISCSLNKKDLYSIILHEL